MSSREPPPPATAGPSPAPALRVDGLTFSYGERFALENVSFSIAPGAVTALLGPNGAGKTTLFALVTRLFDGGSGRISICGHDLRRDSRRALARIGVVFQQPTLDLDLTVSQNLRYFAALHGLAVSEVAARIDAELIRLGLDADRSVRVRTLSGGFRRRCEIARAMLHRPALLLLDEPTVGLDVPSREQIVAHVHALARDDGVAILWATHLIDEVWDGDRLVILHRGRVRADGPVADVIAAAGADSLGEAFARLTGGEADGADRPV